MNKIFKLLLLSATALFAMTGCDDPNYPKEETGEGQIALRTLSLDVTTETTAIESKSSEDVSNYTVRILNKETGATVYEWKYSEMPEVVTLPVATYTIEAFNKTVDDAAWDSPYYYTSKDVDVLKDKISEPGTLTCKLSNVKVSIKYTDELKELIGDGSDVTVKVTVGSSVLDFAYSETRAGYFKYLPESTSLVATFSGTVDGSYIQEYKTLTDIAAGQHRIITFDARIAPDPKTKTGLIGTTGLCLTSTVTVIDLTRDIPVSEDAVEPDDNLSVTPSTLSLTSAGTAKTVTVNASAAWSISSSDSWLKVDTASGSKGATSVSVSADENTTGAARTATLTVVMGNVSRTVTVTQAAESKLQTPSITSSTINLDGVNKVTSTSTVIINLNAPEKLANVKVKIDSKSLTKEMLEEVGLTDEFDLAYPGQYATALSGLKFPVGDQVIGQQTLVFDISSFMAVLSAFQGQHNFEVVITDQQGQSASAVARLLVE